MRWGWARGIGMRKTMEKPTKWYACERNAHSVLFFRAHYKSDSNRRRLQSCTQRQTSSPFQCVCVCINCLHFEWVLCVVLNVSLFVCHCRIYWRFAVVFFHSFLCLLHSPHRCHALFSHSVLAKHAVAAIPNQSATIYYMAHAHTMTSHQIVRMAKMKGIAAKCTAHPLREVLVVEIDLMCKYTWRLSEWNRNDGERRRKQHSDEKCCDDDGLRCNVTIDENEHDQHIKTWLFLRYRFTMEENRRWLFCCFDERCTGIAQILRLCIDWKEVRLHREKDADRAKAKEFKTKTKQNHQNIKWIRNNGSVAQSGIEQHWISTKRDSGASGSGWGSVIETVSISIRFDWTDVSIVKVIIAFDFLEHTILRAFALLSFVSCSFWHG